ncbi:MAG: hypothetical protein KA515_02335 [Candidatus Pacebacteria bacterium]|nr:hypothetical protein [Candidatus Paceibacterota bacterium]
MIKSKHKKYIQGFTIVETMVAVSLFVVITTVGMGSLLNANSVYQKSRDMRSIMDNLNYVMEDMSRNIRTGYGYHCFDSNEGIGSTIDTNPKSCTNGWAISFESSSDGDVTDSNDQWLYYIDSNDGHIFKATEGPYDDPTNSNFTQMTSEEISIDPTLSYFVVTGAEAFPTDNKQPMVTIRLVGNILYKDVITPFALQTSVSQRLVDL